MDSHQGAYGAISQATKISDRHGSFVERASRIGKTGKIMTVIAIAGIVATCAAFRLSYEWTSPAEAALSNGTHEFYPTVVMISIDGTVNHDLDLSVTPHMSSMADRGVRAQWMTPSFPPITFPNHWSLATGLYPETHGVVGNYFFDPVLNDTFDYHDPEYSHDKKWWGGEPIWNTAVRQNKRSAVIMWPGCSTVFDDGLRPTIEVPYNDDMTADEKMALTLDWLDLPLNERPELIAVYIPQVDQAGHRYGPYARETLRTLRGVDESIGQLLDGLAARHLNDIVNIIVVSDHGMSATSKSRVIFYDEELTLAELSMIDRIEAYPLLAIRPVSDKNVEPLYQAFLRLQKLHPRFQVYKREDVPERYHFQHHVRIPPLLVVPDAGWLMATHEDYPDLRGPLKPRGTHGYDNSHPQSRAIFVASGPHFAKHYDPGTVLNPFVNVEVYGLLASMLHLDPAPNNGTLGGEFEAE